MKFMFLIESSFVIAEVGTNCHVDQIVATESECMLAASYFEKRYGGQTTNSLRPAGCYESNGAALFNSIVDPTSTTTSAFYRRAGICRAGILTFRACKNILRKIY